MEVVAVGAEPLLLHCNACGSSFGTRSNVRKRHVASDRHKENVKKMEDAARSQVSIGAAFAKAAGQAAEKEVGKAETAHRAHVVKVLLKAGVALNKLQDPELRALLEDPRPQKLSLGDPGDLARTSMPALTADRDADDVAWIKANGGFFAVSFDGYSKKEEHAVVVARV